MSLGLSNSDVRFLQRQTNDRNLNDVHVTNQSGPNLMEDGLDTNNEVVVSSEVTDINSGTLQAVLPPNILTDSIVKNKPEDNHFVQVTGETSSLGVVTLKTGPDVETAKQIEMVSANPVIYDLSSVTNVCNTDRMQSGILENVGQVSTETQILRNVQIVQGSPNIPVKIGSKVGSIQNMMNVPVQVMTAPNESVYVLALTVEDAKENDGKKIADPIYTPISSESFPEPRRTSTPKSLEDEVLPLDETIIAGNVSLE